MRNLIRDARLKWFYLGLELGIDETTLRVIKQDHRDDTEQCFTEMLSVWLKMASPMPSWEALLAALKQPSLGLEGLVVHVKKKLGLPLDSTSVNVSDGAAIRTGLS